MLSEFLDLIDDLRPLSVVVLLPSREVIEQREATRLPTGYALWTVPALYELFAARTERVGLWLDTSNQSAEQTVAEILSPKTEAELN